MRRPGADRHEAGHGGTVNEAGDLFVSGFECLGACDIAPMASVDGVYYGPLEEADAPTLIDQLRSGAEVLPEKALKLSAPQRAAPSPSRIHASPTRAERSRGGRLPPAVAVREAAEVRPRAPARASRDGIGWPPQPPATPLVTLTAYIRWNVTTRENGLPTRHGSQTSSRLS